MTKRKLLTSVICLLLMFSLVFVACDGDDGDDMIPQATTQPTERTEATTAATQPPMVNATNLQPTILARNTNRVLSRLDPPLTVNIDDETTIDLKYQGWPTICKGEGSTLYAAASARVLHVDPFGVVVFYESHDNGATWSEPKIIVDSPIDDRDAGIVYMGEGRILVSWFTNDGQSYIDGDLSSWRDNSKITDEQEKAYVKSFNKLPAEERQAGSYVMLSEDYGKTWGEPVAVPITAPHGPSLAQDGRTLIYFGTPQNTSLGGFSNFRGGNLYVIKSIDYGKTWQHMATLPNPQYNYTYCEPHAIQLTDGTYLGAIRVHTNVGANDGMSVYITRSQNGRDWTTSKPMDMEKALGGPPHLLQLKSGVVLLTYGYREDPCGTRYRLSYDGGKTWGEEVILCKSDTPKNGDLGYPSTIELDDGTLITAYYQYFRSDSYASFLYTKWTLTEAGATS